MAGGKYLSEEEIYELERRIYNDITVYDGDDDADDWFNEEVAKELMKEGEKYIQWKEHPHYIVTSFGRFINTRTIKITKPIFTTGGVFYYPFGTRVIVEDIFKQAGWKFDLMKVIKTFIDRKWQYKTVGKGIQEIIKNI